MFPIVYLFLIVTTVVASPPSWPNSATDVHTFLTFDDGLNTSQITAAAPYIDFVWGGHAPDVWRTSNPSTIISYYVPYNRDPTASHTLDWWKAFQPSWVMYRCDRTTPATIDPTDTNIPLDITNPYVIAWQTQFVRNASVVGFNAIAVDNFDLNNDERACGVWRGATWVQIYNDTDTSGAYGAAQLKWLAAFHSAVKPLLLIPNYEIIMLPYNSPVAMSVMNAVDGVLDERGYTAWGSAFIGEAEWVNVLQWSIQLQAAGKGFYIINEWGTTPAALSFEVRNWIVASYLSSNNNSSAIYMSCIQCYGWYNPQPEYSMKIGKPLGPAAPSSGGTWVRLYEGGIVLVNPVGTASQNVTLPSHKRFADSRGNIHSGAVTMGGGSGLVLVVV